MYFPSISRVCASMAGVEPTHAASNGARNHCVNMIRRFWGLTSFGLGGRSFILISMQMNIVTSVFFIVYNSLIIVVLIYQGSTLGGTGIVQGKRHPTVGNNVVIGAGAKVLGNIVIGDNSYIGANAVVVKDVPANSTVVGVPGRVTKQDGKKMDVSLDHARILDPIMQSIEELQDRVKDLENK